MNQEGTRFPAREGYIFDQARWDCVMQNAEKDELLPAVLSPDLTHEQLAHVIESKNVTKEEFAAHAEAMDLMLERRRNGEEGVILGPIKLGIGGTINALILLPASRGDFLYPQDPGAKNINDQKILDGTPMLVMIDDIEIAKQMVGANHEDRVTLWQKGFERAVEKVRTEEERSFFDAGGWGNIPLAMKAKGEFALKANIEGVKKIGLVMLPGLFGSMDSMNLDLFTNEGREICDKLRLGHFANQIEQIFLDMANVMIPGIADKQAIADLYDLVIFHSMAGYIGLSYFLRPALFEIAGKMILGNTTKIVVEKGVVIGSEYPMKKEKIPEWMWEVINSPTYKNQVGLHGGLRGFIVKAGAEPFWRKHRWLEWLREVVISNNVPPIGYIFGHYLPKGPLDSDNNRFIHTQSYARYMLFHQLSNWLLRKADPVATEKTMINVSSKGNGLIEKLVMILGGGDTVLSHEIASVMARWLSIPKKNIIGDLGNSEAHQMSIVELVKVLSPLDQNQGLGEFEGESLRIMSALERMH